MPLPTIRPYPVYVLQVTAPVFFSSAAISEPSFLPPPSFSPLPTPCLSAAASAVASAAAASDSGVSAASASPAMADTPTSSANLGDALASA